MDWTTDRPLTHPGAQRFVADLVKGLSGKVFLARRRPIIFVCGGAMAAGVTNLRSGFLAWARANIGSKANLLLSEDAYKAALKKTTKFINLSEFEQILADVADCILLFPESAGSYSELGIFATQTTIRNKTLIANDSFHTVDDSFLLLGPIHTIDSDSVFNPSVMYDSRYGFDSTFADRIWKRIDARITDLKNSYRLDAKHFVDLKVHERLAVLSWILKITGIATFGDLLDIIRLAYPKRDEDARVLRGTLHILLALKQVKELSTDLYTVEVLNDFDLEVPGDLNKLSAQFRLFWNKEFPKLWGYTS